MAKRINEEHFTEEVLEKDVPVLVDFYSDSCVACKKLSPTLSDIEEEYEGKLEIFKVNTGFDGNLAKIYEVQANPTLVIFHDGKALSRKVGAISYDEIAEWIDEVL